MDLEAVLARVRRVARGDLRKREDAIERGAVDRDPPERRLERVGLGRREPAHPDAVGGPDQDHAPNLARARRDP